MTIGALQETAASAGGVDQPVDVSTRLRVVGGLDMISDALSATAAAVVGEADDMESEPTPEELQVLLQTEARLLGRPFLTLAEKWDAEERVVAAWRLRHHC